MSKSDRRKRICYTLLWVKSLLILEVIRRAHYHEYLSIEHLVIIRDTAGNNILKQNRSRLSVYSLDVRTMVSGDI